MSDIKLISDETPQEVKKYNLKIEQLEVGKSGKVGILDVELKQNDKLGGQHKIPRLSNDRNWIEEMKQFMKL